VIAQTIGQKLPEGFQRAEFLVEKGIIDGMVERKDLKQTIARLVALHSKELSYTSYPRTRARFLEDNAMEQLPEEQQEDVQSGEKTKKKDNDEKIILTTLERMVISRSSGRPTSLYYIGQGLGTFGLWHGDRAFRDDGAVVGVIGTLIGQPVT